MQVTCSKCPKEFNIALMEKDHGNGIIETFFLCPHCSEHYTAFYMDDEVRKIQKQIDSLKSARHPVRINNNQHSIRRLEKRKRKKMDGLKLKMLHAK